MSSLTLIHAGMIADAAARHAPGALLLRGRRVVAVGGPSEVGRPASAEVRSLPAAVVLPALVNAHSHLDLSDLAPRPYGGDFAAWIDAIRTGRARDPGPVRDAVRRGAALCRAGGVALVGDIAGADWRLVRDQLARGRLVGTCFAEVIGIGRGRERALDAVRALEDADEGSEDGVRVGVSPHAPYTCAREVYRACRALGRPLATHLAETAEELQFVRSADGPLAGMLRRLGLWDATIRPAGGHPVDALADVLGTGPTLAAHLNYVDGERIRRLARLDVSVAYCPRASAYFGHADHRYREMMAAGVNVALGTDGLPCLDTPDRISVLDEMRLLRRRDGADPGDLLAMATVNGARALGLEPALVRFAPDAEIAGAIAVPFEPRDAADPLEQVLSRRDAPTWIVERPARERALS